MANRLPPYDIPDEHSIDMAGVDTDTALSSPRRTLSKGATSPGSVRAKGRTLPSRSAPVRSAPSAPAPGGKKK